MRKIILVVLACAGLLALPGSASAVVNDGNTCSYATDGSETAVNPAGGTVVIYAGPGGMTDEATLAAGGCVNLGSGAFQGGALEVGNRGTEAYAVIDGDNGNADPSGQSDGYMGLSNFESGTGRDSNCANGPDQGQGGTSNSGGCVGVDNGPWLPVPLISCGNSSGNTWASTTNPNTGLGRDGCSIP